MLRRALAACLAAAFLTVMSGCASYRVSSNVEPGAPTATPPTTQIILAEDNLPSRKYSELGPIEVSAKKLTLFHKDPIKEQANEALNERARALGADAVINITYETGIGFTTWGYIDAKGTAVKFLP
jgi:hypothetical protein